MDYQVSGTVKRWDKEPQSENFIIYITSNGAGIYAVAMMNYAGRYHSTDMTIPMVQPGHRKFGKAFWGLVNNMTAEEYARCTPAEQN
jgi:hypothetical protein